jgi:hypothetical protein
MAWSFNPFTGNLDIVGGGAVVFEGEVETFADLPETIGDPAVGASFLVRSSTGVWLVNRRQAGIWIRRNDTGVRATDWEYGGDYPVNSVNGQTGNVSLGSSDVAAEPIDYTVVTTAQTLINGAKVAADTTAGAFTLTLPATPSNGDTITVLDYAGTFDTNNLTIARNGSNIESLAEDMTCNVEDAAFTLVFVGSTVGWKVVPYFGNGGKSDFNDANFLLYDNADSSKNLAFQLSGISASTTRTLTVPDASGTIALTGQLTDTKVYTANDTWTKPAGAKMVHYIVIGGGGGGGGGRCDNAGTDRSGGGGGCAGGIAVGWLDASALGATEAITVGAGGAGGSGRSTANNGQAGSSGGVSSIGSVIQTFASVGGGGGGTTTGSGGTGANNSARIYSADGATNGGVNGSNAGRLQGSAVFNSPTGGQGGSGISAANVVSASAAAADSGHVRTGALVAGGTGGASAAGGNGNSGGMNFVGTGGGGGSPNSSTGAGNAGGNGGLYGGGGGGGSAGALPAASGAGGNGAAGIVVITTYF